VSVVSITDEMEARRLGPVGLLAVQALKQRALDEELEIRRRIIEDPGPTPEWVERVRAHIRERKPNPRVVVGGEVVSAGKEPMVPRSIDFRRGARAQFEIRLLGQTADHIRAEVNDVAPYGVETGGYLYAHQPNRYFDTAVCLVTGPGPNSRHGRDSLQLSHPHEIESAFPDWLPPENFVRVGDFHSHPNGTPTPSRADMNSWAAILKRRRYFTYVSIIVTPSPGDGSGPQLHGWVTRRDSYGTSFRVEPAHIET
jgi:proteasome lid subunit RPN8/RPN11